MSSKENKHCKECYQETCFVRQVEAEAMRERTIEIINDLESNPDTTKNWNEYKLQYWIEAKQKQLREKFNLK